MAKGCLLKVPKWCTHGQFLHTAWQATCRAVCKNCPCVHHFRKRFRGLGRSAGTCDASVMVDQQRCRSSYLSCGSNIKSTHSDTVRGELSWRRIENRCPASTVESSAKTWQRKKLSREIPKRGYVATRSVVSGAPNCPGHQILEFFAKFPDNGKVCTWHRVASPQMADVLDNLIDNLRSQSMRISYR